MEYKLDKSKKLKQRIKDDIRRWQFISQLYGQLREPLRAELYNQLCNRLWGEFGEV